MRNLGFVNDRRILAILRMISVLFSVICLIVSVFLMFRMIASDRQVSEKDAVSPPVEVEHRVLFICSYNPLYFTYDLQIKGIEEGLYPNDIEYDVVFLDSKNYNEPKDSEAFYDFLKSRMDGRRQYEAVLAGDDDALKFTMKYQDELFPEMPIVYFGINELELAKQAQEYKNITGYYEQNYLGDTIELAVKLFPGRKKLTALHDNSAAGAADMKIFEELQSLYPDFEFLEINTSVMTEEELGSALSNLDDDSVLIYMTAYTDSEGNTYSMESRTRFVVEHTNVPIFRNYTGGEGEGILGGVCMDFVSQCREAGQLVSDYLEGRKDLSDKQLNDKPASLTQFDFQLMEQYDLDYSMLPVETVYYNKPVTFAEKYGSIMAPVILIAAALLLLILSSQMSVRAAKITNSELVKARDP